MAISTEENNLESKTLTPEEEIKVIAIKLPFDLQDRLLTFPFLHALNNKYPDAEIHFITPKKEIEVLNMLPFKAFYHEFDEDEIRTIFDVHRYTANAKIFNVDLYISLTNSFADACLGLGLRAKKRLGFSDGWKTLVLNQKLPRPIGQHVCEDYFSLLKTHLGHEIDTKVKVMSRELPPVIEDWDKLPYIAINLAPMRDAVISSEWIEFISFFENQRLIFFSSEDQVRFHMQFEPFLARLPKKNLYTFHIYKDWIDLAKVLCYAKGVVTYNGPLASYSSYVGSKTLIMYDQEDPQRHAPLYFLSDVVMLGSVDPNNIDPQSGQVVGGLKQRKRFDMGQVFDRASNFFKF